MLDIIKKIIDIFEQNKINQCIIKHKKLLEKFKNITLVNNKKKEDKHFPEWTILKQTLKKSNKKGKRTFNIRGISSIEHLKYIITQLECYVNVISMNPYPFLSLLPSIVIDETNSKSLYKERYKIKIFPPGSFLTKNNCLYICDCYYLTKNNKDEWNLYFDYDGYPVWSTDVITKKIKNFNDENNLITNDSFNEMIIITNNTKSFSGQGTIIKYINERGENVTITMSSPSKINEESKLVIVI